MDELTSGSREARIRLCFNMIDTNKNGYITQNELFSLIRSITLSHYKSSYELDQMLKKDQQITNYLFNMFDPSKRGYVSFDDFNEAIQEDYTLMEIFTLLNKGIYEHFITKVLEDSRRHWFMNKTKYISMSLGECLAFLEETQTPRENFKGLKLHKVDSKPHEDRFKNSSIISKVPAENYSPGNHPASVKSLHENFVEKKIIARETPNGKQNGGTISCTPGMYMDTEKQKKRKFKHKDTENPYEQHPLQEIEILIEDARTEQAKKEILANNRLPSPLNSSGLLPANMKRPLNMKPLELHELDGRCELTIDDYCTETARLNGLDENVKVSKVPAMNLYFLNQMPTREIPPPSEKFHEFGQAVYRACYDMEEKEEEERKSLYSSAIIGPSEINLKLESPKRSKLASFPINAQSLGNVQMSQPAQYGIGSSLNVIPSDPPSDRNSLPSPKRPTRNLKYPLLPPSPNTNDSNFILKSKIRDLIKLTENLYHTVMKEKNKESKK